MTDLLTDRQRARLTEAEIRRSKPPAAGNVIRYDTEVPGFGLRITAAGARSFVLNCDGRERRLTHRQLAGLECHRWAGDGQGAAPSDRSGYRSARG